MFQSISDSGLIPATYCCTMMMMNSLWQTRKRIIGLIALVLLFMLMSNLNSRLSELFRLSSQQNDMSTQVGNAQATISALQSQVAYATSDQAVEDWARDEARLAKPNEKVIIPVTPRAQVNQPTPQPTPTQPPAENWQVWWALFFRE